MEGVKKHMIDKGFENYLFAFYGHKTGTAKSYITAIQIIDEMFSYEDLFALNKKSISCIEDIDLLEKIADFIYIQLTLYNKRKDSIFRNINSKQISYPKKGFCSAAVKQLLNYRCGLKLSEAEIVIKGKKNGKNISKDLIAVFEVDKEGTDVVTTAKVRLGQDYFRKMVMTNYQYKCCVTGLNVPQTLRASHIVAWAKDVKNRMNPENGLCLSATYDAAFDKHLISFDDDYRMIVSRVIKDFYTNEVTKDYFEKYEGKQITLPELFLPNKKLLGKHRELLLV